MRALTSFYWLELLYIFFTKVIFYSEGFSLQISVLIQKTYDCIVPSQLLNTHLFSCATTESNSSYSERVASSNSTLWSSFMVIFNAASRLTQFLILSSWESIMDSSRKQGVHDKVNKATWLAYYSQQIFLLTESSCHTGCRN